MASGVTMRSLAAARARRWQQTSSPPAISISSETQPMPAISGSSHSSKKTRGRGLRCCCARDRLEAPRQGVRQRVGGVEAIDQRPEGADHREDAGHVTLVEQMDGQARAGEVVDDSCLQIGEREDEIGLERQDLRQVGRGERRDPRLLAPDPRRPHGIA
jgi:hypothetical protein